MLEQQGQVMAVSGRFATVRLGGNSGCPACDAGKGCGAGVFGRWFKRRPVTLDVVNEIDVRVGQTVMIGLPESLFLVLVFRLYLFPLVAGLAGLILGHYLSGVFDEVANFADGFALVGGIITGSVAIWWNRRALMEFPRQTSVHLMRILGHEDQGRCGSAES